MLSPSPKKLSHAGFTLVEMSLVLVIIGIILASVMKGRDLITSAQESQQEQNYFQKWLTITNDYYTATRNVLGDGVDFGGQDDQPDGFADLMYSYEEDHRDQIMNALNTVGIDPCVLVKSNLNDLDIANSAYVCPNNLNPFQTMLDTEFSGKVRTYVAWLAYHIVMPNAAGKTGKEHRDVNMLAFINVPIAYAKRLDATIDGVVDGTSGKCRNIITKIDTEYPVTENILNNGLNSITGAGYTERYTTTGGTEFHQLYSPSDWATDASNRDLLYTVGILLDY